MSITITSVKKELKELSKRKLLTLRADLNDDVKSFPHYDTWDRVCSDVWCDKDDKNYCGVGFACDYMDAAIGDADEYQERLKKVLEAIKEELDSR